MGRRTDVRNDNFYVCGPTHLTETEIDWNNEEHRQCIAASLVKGTYILESELQARRRRGRREGEELELLAAPAAAWWENFHFRLHSELQCGCNCVCCKHRRRMFRDQSTRSFVYGAVFEYVPPDDGNKTNRQQPPSAPRYVVAFRGTMPRDATVFSDMRVNLRVLLNMQRYCGRFTDARRHVTSLLDSTTAPPPAASSVAVAASGKSKMNCSNSVVWLAGHSLGASIALDVGRDMVTTRGLNLPTFLFNPPHVSAAPLLDVVMPEEAKRDLYVSSYVLKCALGMTVMRSHRKHMEELFKQLSPWAPNLYVHRRDPICKGFIDYFEQREQVREWSTRVANSAATLAYRDMAYSVFHQQSERQHLLPCAVLWTSSHGEDPHGLQQWWQSTGPELDYLSRKEYSWSLI